MSKQMIHGIRPELAVRWTNLSQRIGASVARFRESRLYIQLWLCLGLVALAAAVSVLPQSRPVAAMHRAMVWVATHDYDFGGALGKSKEWLDRSGGVIPVIKQTWGAGTQRVAGWLPSPVDGSFAEPTDQGRVVPTRERRELNLAPILPVSGAVLHSFGWLPHNVGEAFHEGIDFIAPIGSPVGAVTGGTVLRVLTDPRLGGLVEIDHGGAVALYGQMEGITAQVGQAVLQGQTIGEVAPSRGAEEQMEPHLHFEVRTLDTGVPVDPAFYLGLGGNSL